jgi:putative ABC transport system permease protein
LIAFGVVFVLVFVAVTASIKDFMIAQITDSYLGDLQIHRGGYVASIETLPLNLNLTSEAVSSIEKVLGGLKEVDSYSERIKFGALFSNFTETTNIRINGVYAEKEFAALPQMLSRISEGEKSVRALEKGKILVPKLLAQGFGAKVGDTVVVVATNKDGSVNGKTFLVSGILESATGPGGRDGYINFEDAREILRISGKEVSEIVVSIKSLGQVEEVAQSIRGGLGLGEKKTKGGRYRGPYVVAALPLRQHRQHDRPDDLFHQADAHRDCLDQYSQRDDHGGL